MNARERLQAINRTLDALGTVEACFDKTEDPPGNVKFKRGVHGALGDFKLLLLEWAESERERLS